MNGSLIMSKKNWMKFGLLTALFIFCYFKTILLLIDMWVDNDAYSHGFLVPFISLYFIWHKREKLKSIAARPSIIGGMIVTLTGSLMLLLGRVGSVAIVHEVSIIVLIAGLVLMILGVRYLKAISLPIAYLIIMIPFFDYFSDKVHWPFQLFSANVASALLNFINIPVLRETQYLIFPSITLEVARACSGVNFLISIVAVGIPLAYFTQNGWTKRLALIIFAIIIGILANSIRVTLIGVWTYKYSSALVHGPLHILEGTFVSLVGFFFLFIAAGIIRKFSPRNVKESSLNSRDEKNNFPSRSKQSNLVYFAAVIILLCLGLYLNFYHHQPVSTKVPINEFPLTIGGWKGSDISDYRNSFRIHGADSELVRAYRDESGREIMLYIGYFETQSGDKELVNYLFPLSYMESKEVEIQTVSQDPVWINEVTFKENEINSLVLFWYDLNGRVVSSRNRAKYFTAYDGLFHGRTNGAIIIVYSNLNDDENYGKVMKKEKDFVRELVPLLEEYLPETG